MSNIIEVAIDTWVKVKTWHESHPSDLKRFHDAIHQIVKSGLHNFDIDDFEEILRYKVVKYHPQLDEDYIDMQIDHFVKKADIIIGYLHDVN